MGMDAVDVKEEILGFLGSALKRMCAIQKKKAAKEAAHKEKLGLKKKSQPKSVLDDLSQDANATTEDTGADGEIESVQGPCNMAPRCLNDVKALALAKKDNVMVDRATAYEDAQELIKRTRGVGIAEEQQEDAPNSNNSD